MAVTALKIGDQRLKFMTLPAELIKSKDGETEKLFLTVDLRICDEDFIPMGVGSISVHEGDEESYHKALRAAAKEKGHFVPEESTDHQWHPDYNPVQDIDHEEIKEDGDTV
ncbi:MAG TPA: hypothetical protein PK432_02180 [Candidatus Dojkabacteria bacterium]|jgi:hypothetical protein|nr:hypothetical protein [Candidatus Dojkabacteria bacterium]